MTAQTTTALEAARRLAEAGVPIFLAEPIKTGKVGFRLPRGWERMKPDPDLVDDWEPGMALCAVMGHTVDAIDVDPRNGGTLEALREALGGELPTIYGRATTPSGGEHYLVASMGVRKAQNIVPGVDIQAGNGQGVGRGFIFLAPTVRKSKADGELRAYEWVEPPDISMLLVVDDESIGPLRALVEQRHAEPERPEVEDEWPSYGDLDVDKQSQADAHVVGVLSDWQRRFTEALEWPEEEKDDKGRGWEKLAADFAWALAAMVVQPWVNFDEDDAKSSYEGVVPTEIANDVEYKWGSDLLVKAVTDMKHLAPPPWVERGDPMLDFADDEAVTKSVWPDIPAKFTDGDLAVWMAHKGLGGDWRWNTAQGWLHWSGARWEERSEAACREACRKAFHRLVIDAAKTGDPDLIKVCNSLMYKSRVSAVMAFLQGVVETPTSKFDQHHHLLNTPNGIVDLTSGDLLPHDRKYLMTKITRAPYEPGAVHADWEQCLTALEPEVMDWMQLRFGQAVTGWPTSDDILPVGVGTGSNGKSTLVSGIMTALGAYAVLVPDKLLRASPNDHPTEMMTLLGARVAVIEETPEAGHLNVQRLKMILGTPTITSRAMYRDNVSWEATHSPFLFTNYAPQVKETDHGTWRRLAMIRFDRTFPPQDGFRQGIVAGDGGRQEAILAWLVDGAVRWFDGQRRLPVAPAKVVADTQWWRAESDVLTGFLQEGHVEKDPNHHVVVNDFLAVFNRWLESRGQSKWSAATMASRLGSHPDFGRVKRVQLAAGATVERPDSYAGEVPKRPWVWLGLKWPETADESTEADFGNS